MRSCIEADREEDRKFVMNSWMAFNLDGKEIKQYSDPKGVSAKKSQVDTSSDWERLARSMRKVH